MMQAQQITRGRPAGQLTSAKRRALSFILAKQAANEIYTRGQMMRVCGFSCRANARRTLKGLQQMGMV